MEQTPLLNGHLAFVPAHFSVLFYGCICKRVKWSQSCVLIDCPNRQDEPILPTRDFPHWSRKEKLFWPCNSLFSLSRNQNYKMQTITYRKSSIWEMKENKYTKSLAKNQDCDISYTRYSEKSFTQIYQALYGDAMLVSLWGAQIWRPETNRNICLWVFLKSVNSSLEELTEIKVIFILRQAVFRLQNLKKSVTFVTHLRAFPVSC